MRLFIAIPIDRPILDALAGAADRLRETRAPVRWVRPGGMHLTLKFLGVTDLRRVPSLADSMAAVCGAVEPCPVSVTGMGAYPNLRRPRVIWAGVEEPSGVLKRLWESTEETAMKLGWEREKRRFSPHITIGRVKGNVNISRLSEAVRAQSETHWGEQVVDCVVLYRSHLKPGGAEYERIHVFPLGKRGTSV